jgi:DNA-binding MarR family transcriptional regulator
MVDEKEKPSAPPARLETFEEIAKRYPSLDPQAMHAYVVMRKAQARIDLALDAHLSRKGLSFGRYLVLVHLIRAEGHSLTPAQLAESCGITRATITGLVDTLEKAGQVVREEDPSDRRSLQVRLTLSGRRFLEEMLPDHFKRLMEMMSGFTPAELKTLEKFCQKLAAGAAALERP